MNEIIEELIQIAGIRVETDGVYVGSLKYSKDAFSEELYTYLMQREYED